jgi:Rrf2 family protein
MRITRGGDYAVRIMTHLASAPWGAVIPRRHIRLWEDVPQALLAKLIQTLGRANLVTTSRGSGGGVRLAVRPEAITLRQVIEAVEGPIHLNRCLVSPGACPRDAFCTAHPVWRRIQEVLMRELDSVTLASLATGSSRAREGNGSPAQASEAVGD